MGPIVIIGTGQAGSTVARELRALAPQRPVTLVTREEGHFYPKPKLSTALRLGASADSLIQMSADALRTQGVRLIGGTDVVRVETDERLVVLDDGRKLPYRDLVLATGAQPRPLAVPGGARHVVAVNDLTAYRRFRELVGSAAGTRVLIIGAGLVGLEFAADLIGVGHAVTVVDLGIGPLPRLLPPRSGRLVAMALEASGIHFHWQCSLTRLTGAPGAYEATLSNGHQLRADVVLSALGLLPQATLGPSFGLEPSQGFAVDRMLRIAPGVYALGDCAVLPGGLYLPYIRPITDQARHVARAIAGLTDSPLTLPSYAVKVKVPQWPIASTAPLPGEQGTWTEELTATGSAAWLRDADNRLLRVVLTGDRASAIQAWVREVPAPLPPPLLGVA